MKVNENSMNTVESMNFNKYVIGTKTQRVKDLKKYDDLRNILNHFANTIKRMS